ncbi:EamA-like transporter family protein [Nakamurella panacisegetis]|uniref:EamA-like transporter family protein n=1 Tax=Nakamurella panacisegetis TaxID=1090615 RepID=A0A1H0R122_9ACTN|nr:EamA-like transporter family protein [Nakamurella panacisegetis]
MGRRARDLTWLVALGAALWGTDAIFRQSLAQQVSAPTLVFAEHLVLVLVLLPFLPRSLRAFGRLDRRGKVAVLAIGAGASALATVLFTIAFRISSEHNDFVTPVVVQHLQPLVAIGGAVALLGEKVRTRFALFAVPAVVGVWLLAFPDPFDITVSRLGVVLLALAAAVLWAGGTVLGRLVATELEPVELTTLRFAFGLPTAAVLVAVSGNTFWVPDLGSAWAVVGLAIVPGLLAMVLYYVGLRRTAASRATLAELAYPVTGAFVGLMLGRSLHWSQLVGAAVIVVAVTGLSWHETKARNQAIEPAVVPSPVALPALL